MPRRNKTYHYLYKTTCIPTGKYYIGMHSTDNLKDGYLGSGKRLWYTRKKYGDENHKKEILEFFSNREDLKKREKQVIDEEKINDPLCINLTIGGGGGWSSEQQKKNAEKSNLKQKWLWENDLEWSQKTRKNISIANKRSYEKGTRKKHYFYDWSGLKHKEESKKKIGLKNSVLQKGKNNSQFGTKWITKNGENKKIKKDLKVPNGWLEGRDMKDNYLLFHKQIDTRFSSVPQIDFDNYEKVSLKFPREINGLKFTKSEDFYELRIIGKDCNEILTMAPKSVNGRKQIQSVPALASKDRSKIYISSAYNLEKLKEDFERMISYLKEDLKKI